MSMQEEQAFHLLNEVHDELKRQDSQSMLRSVEKQQIKYVELLTNMIGDYGIEGAVSFAQDMVSMGETLGSSIAPPHMDDVFSSLSELRENGISRDSFDFRREVSNMRDNNLLAGVVLGDNGEPERRDINTNVQELDDAGNRVQSTTPEQKPVSDNFIRDMQQIWRDQNALGEDTTLFESQMERRGVPIPDRQPDPNATTGITGASAGPTPVDHYNEQRGDDGAGAGQLQESSSEV